jgi:hypothetical protein
MKQITKDVLIEVLKIFLSPIALAFLFLVFFFGQLSSYFYGIHALFLCVFMYLSFFGLMITINHSIVMNKLYKIEKMLKNERIN